jgi:hypothetical protein
MTKDSGTGKEGCWIEERRIAVNKSDVKRPAK